MEGRYKLLMMIYICTHLPTYTHTWRQINSWTNKCTVRWIDIINTHTTSLKFEFLLVHSLSCLLNSYMKYSCHVQSTEKKKTIIPKQTCMYIQLSSFDICFSMLAWIVQISQPLTICCVAYHPIGKTIGENCQTDAHHSIWWWSQQE